MKLLIKDIAWGIDRRSGERVENLAGEFELEVRMGALDPIGVAKKVFEVKEINEDSIRIQLGKNDERTLPLGKTITYRPMSFDGGHYYELRLD